VINLLNLTAQPTHQLANFRIGSIYCDVAIHVLFNYYSALDKHAICLYVCLFVFLAKSFSIVYFVVFTVATMCGE